MPAMDMTPRQLVRMVKQQLLHELKYCDLPTDRHLQGRLVLEQALTAAQESEIANALQVAVRGLFVEWADARGGHRRMILRLARGSVH
jgi:hypothetical protein